jgi:N-methylhydantoinase A
MVAFGGAGPLHAARLAHALAIPRVIVPHGAGVGSAIGLLQAEPRIDVSMTRVMPLDGDAAPAIAAIYAELEEQARADLTRLGMDGAPHWSRFAYMRYAGQGYEVRTDLPDGDISDDYASRAMTMFNDAYERQYRYRETSAAIEAVDWYLVASLTTGHDGAASAFVENTDGAREAGQRRAWFPECGGYCEVPVIDRAAMRIGETLSGPTLIEEPDSTTVVLPGDRATISPRGHLIVEIRSEQ